MDIASPVLEIFRRFLRRPTSKPAKGEPDSKSHLRTASRAPAYPHSLALHFSGAGDGAASILEMAFAADLSPRAARSLRTGKASRA